jgi:SPP1 family predicted phage head-tail adaptor
MPRLRQRATLQKPTTEEGDGGSVTTTYADVRTVWVDIRTLRGNAYWQGQQERVAATHEVYGRYQSLKGVRKDWQLSYDGRTFAVRDYMDADTRQRYIKLICNEERP